MRMRASVSPRAHRALKWLAWACAVAAVLLFVTGLIFGSFGELRTKSLLTFVGIVFGAAILEINLRAIPRYPMPALASLVPLLASQICYYLLVWTGWRSDQPLWANWWMSMVGSVTAAHVLLLLGAETHPTRLGKWTRICAVVSGLMLMSLALRDEILGNVWLGYWIALSIPATVSVAGSTALWIRFARRTERRRTLPKWGWNVSLVGSHIALLLVGFYVGRGTTATESTFQRYPSALAGLSVEEVDRQVRADLERLQSLAGGLADVARKSTAAHRDLEKKRKEESRDYYRPEEEDQIRWHYVTYLSYRSALLRIVATYSGFQAVRDADTQARCFMVGYAAATTSFEFSLSLVNTYGNDPIIRRKLDEAEPLWGLPEKTYQQIYDSVSNKNNLELCQEMGEWFDHHRPAWENRGVWDREEFWWLANRIDDSRKYMAQEGVSRVRGVMSRFIEKVKEDTYSPIYAVQSMVSTWIGDMRIVEEQPLITYEQIDAIATELKPGDILLERRNWYLSNAFLPGFWPHGALYVGTWKDVERLGIAEHPEVKTRWEQFKGPAPDGHAYCVIESISDGVVMNSLHHSMHADNVAVLRPRLTEAQIAEAITRAFSHEGKPYDFEFDFFTSDKLVCTELVYRAYQGFINFDLVKVMGRDTLPAIEIAKKFENERASGDRELDFVLFLDGVRKEGKAVRASEDEFCKSWRRPRAFNE